MRLSDLVCGARRLVLPPERFKNEPFVVGAWERELDPWLRSEICNFIEIWRPHLPDAAASPYLFLPTMCDGKRDILAIRITRMCTLLGEAYLGDFTIGFSLHCIRHIIATAQAVDEIKNSAGDDADRGIGLLVEQAKSRAGLLLWDAPTTTARAYMRVLAKIVLDYSDKWMARARANARELAKKTGEWPRLAGGVLGD
ncbi:MAG: hypothetical protein IT577_19330 [Verrucomicrobiae bacterium]|nr:hypothetical protein [Verrucomicrobiae bacterium]